MTLDDKVSEKDKPTERLERRFCVGYKTRSHEYFTSPKEPILSIQYCASCNEVWTIDNQQFIPPFGKNK